MVRLSQRPLWIVLVVAGIVRAATLGIGWSQFAADPDAYDAIARTLARSGTIGLSHGRDEVSPTAFRPPLYPAILAVIHRRIIASEESFADPRMAEAAEATTETVRRSAIAGLHWVLGMLTVALTYLVAKKLLMPSSSGSEATGESLPSPGGYSQRAVEPVAALAAVAVAVDPILLQSSVLVMTETLATALAMAGLLIWTNLVVSAVPGASDQSPVAPGASDRRCRWGPSARFFQRSVFQGLALGVVLGLAYLCRPTFIVWAALLIGYGCGHSLVRTLRRFSLWRCRSDRRIGAGDRSRRTFSTSRSMTSLLAFGCSGLVILGFVAAWTFRNERQLGHPIWATTHGGYTLLLGNNRSFFEYVRDGEFGVAWDPNEFFRRWEQRTRSDPRSPRFWAEERVAADPAWRSERPAAGDEVAEDRLAYETAKRAIADDPAGFFLACVWRIGRLLGPMPQRQLAGGAENRRSADRIGRIRAAGWGVVLVTLFYVVVTASAAWGWTIVVRRRWHPGWFGALALVLSLIAVHTFYWSNMRMRAPAIPVLAILAVVPLAGWRRFDEVIGDGSPGCVAATDRH